MLLYIHLLWHLYDCLLYLPVFLINNIFFSHHYVPFCESYKRPRLATCLEIHESCFVSFTAMHGSNASLYQNTHKYLVPWGPAANEGLGGLWCCPFSAPGNSSKCPVHKEHTFQIFQARERRKWFISRTNWVYSAHWLVAFWSSEMSWGLFVEIPLAWNITRGK